MARRWRYVLKFQHTLSRFYGIATALIYSPFKAFDTLPHKPTVEKLKSYGADDNTTDLVHDYLSNRLQRVRLGDQYSKWKEISAGVPQGSVLGPLIFNIFMNDLVYAVKQSKSSAYADDTQIFFAESKSEKVEEMINADLAKVDRL